jgi:hypothetical protein
MRSKNSFKFSTNPFNRYAGPPVSRIGVQANPERIPVFEGVCQHERLGLGIRSGPDR